MLSLLYDDLMLQTTSQAVVYVRLLGSLRCSSLFVDCRSVDGAVASAAAAGRERMVGLDRPTDGHSASLYSCLYIHTRVGACSQNALSDHFCLCAAARCCRTLHLATSCRSSSCLSNLSRTKMVTVHSLSNAFIPLFFSFSVNFLPYEVVKNIWAIYFSSSLVIQRNCSRWSAGILWKKFGILNG